MAGFRFSVPMMAGALIAALFTPAKGAGTPWHVAGDLSEACTCSVPCPCNFGQAPSGPHCWAVFSMDIHEGNYGTTKLDGLRMAFANGQKGGRVYLDDRANPEQTAALKGIAQKMFAKMMKANGMTDTKHMPMDAAFLGFQKAHIDQYVGDKKNWVKIGNAGGFSADYIMGMDGKTPVGVSNNWSFNLQDGIKAKTRRLYYKDSFGNHYDLKATNSNQGKFDWSDTTPIYFR